MGTTRSIPPNLLVPWDTLLGTKSNVRVLRVLERTRESMTVRELARRAGEHLRAVQIAVSRLVEGGLVERVGTGPRQHVRLNTDHPLTPALETLFQAERTRVERIVGGLRRVARKVARRAEAVWLTENGLSEEAQLEVAVLASSGEVDALVDGFRSAIADLMRREDVHVEVRGWTRPDLRALQASFVEDRAPIILLGHLPEDVSGEAGRSRRGRRSHLAADEKLRNRARRVVAALKRRPELMRAAREELAARVNAAPPQEARTLREWLDVLDSMSVTQLSRWLVSKGERATRLRQSMPVSFLRAADDDASHHGSKP
jgi:DNA-binding transcriptional ArsR family regulator